MSEDSSEPKMLPGAPLFPVVGIGASAGGLEALRGLFKAMPGNTGAGFVLVQHLDPTHDSLMAELLTKYARIPVVQVDDGMRVEPNRLYVIPPNTVMTISEGVLHLSEPTERRGLRMPIDRFFSSLAEDQQERAIAVVLSGAGTDGTYGVRLVKARGGMVLAQDPTLAGYDGMPRSAVATGDVDYVLPVEEIPEVLVRYIEHFRTQGGSELGYAREDKDFMDSILALLIARQDYDFRCYKRGTINRRILRRMGLNHVSSLEEYHRQLRNDDTEVRALAKDLLIGVTSFFREPEAWQLLRDKVLPELLSQLGPDDVIRTWVPGCATGEEAYSLAMVLTEAAEATGRNNNLIVFATDVDREALEVARNGIYAESLVADIEPERLKRFFSHEGDNYQIKKGLREKVIFAPQNLISDPPFSALSLISCRNLLIYIEPEYQDRLLALFHFSLREGGCLFLGSSETVGHNSRLFTHVSKHWRIYRRTDAVRPANLEFPSGPGRHRGWPPGRSAFKRRRGDGYGPLAHKALIEQFAPASVLVDRGYRVLYYHGAVREYLGPAPGDPSDDLLAQAGEGLRGKLRTALRQAAAEEQRVELGGAHVRRGEQWYTVSVTVAPIRESETSEGLLLVSFRDEHKAEPGEKSEIVRSSGEEAVLTQLEAELKATRDELRSTIEQMETSNEELKASNEEVMSMNEELQSTNEELETSKEELQSLNEELTTLNSQLEDKVHELEETNNDLSNLLVSTDIATLFLDRRFRIRRYTPAIGHLMRLIPADVGRGVTDITWRFEDTALLDDARAVLAGQDLEPREIQGRNDRWYLRRVLPYYTEDDETEGVVITFTDITQRKRMEHVVAHSEEVLRRVTNAVPVLISRVDMDGIYRFNNAAYEQWFGLETEQIRDRPVREVVGEETYAVIKPHMERALAGNRDSFEAELPYRLGGTRYVEVDYVPDRDGAGQVQGFFALIHDLSERRRAEQALSEREAEFRALFTVAGTGVAEADVASGRFLRVNPKFCEITGYAETELLQRSYSDLTHPEDRDLDRQRVGAVFRGDTAHWESEKRYVRKDGEIVWVWVTGSLICDASGNPWRTAAVIIDISSRKQLEQELVARNDRLETVDRRKNEFLAMLGHELRNPLSPIRNVVQMMNMEGKEAVDMRWAAEVIERQSQHLERMADDLLDMARIQKGRLAIEHGPQRVGRLIQDAISAVQTELDAKDQRLHLALAEEPVIVSGDATRLIQVLCNLLKNAVRYTPEGGEIQVSLTRAGDDYAQITVEDTGNGISAGLLPHVFDIFNDSEPRPERSNAGLGLGLGLVKQIVRLHGGEVTAASDGPGLGSRFTVCLPLAADDEEELAPALVQPTGPVSDTRSLDILLVDDNADVLDSLKQLLNALGHRVRSLDSGREVAASVQENPPDLLLLDLGLPDMSGQQVAKALAGLPQRSRLKLVAVTGYAADPEVDAQSELGFDGYLLKPVTLEMLKPYLG